MARYTAVFEWADGEEPVVSRTTTLLGGRIIAVQFSDALQELERYRTALEHIADEDFDFANGPEVAEMALRS
jgi:hypothetical protein